MNNYGQRQLTMVRGQGAYLYDSNGEKYLDFTAGIAVCNLGHAHPRITCVINEQATQLLHCSNLYLIPQQQQLAQVLTELSGLDAAFFCNSGTEANEAALKLARKYASLTSDTRTKLVSLPGAFHGRTFGALSVTPKFAYQQGYQPLLPGCSTANTYEETIQLIDEQTAACIVEVIQGEGGVQPVPLAILLAIQARCLAMGTLLIVDEVQTGCGRTGSFFAYSEVGLEPDIVTMAKGLGNGVPIGAVLARREVAAAFSPGSHGSTFGGNPLAMAVACAVVDEILQPSFLPHVVSTGEYLARALTSFGTNITGQGLMWGMTVANAKEFVQFAAERGVLLTAVGDCRVRLVPPLIITASHVDEFVERLRDLAWVK